MVLFLRTSTEGEQTSETPSFMKKRLWSEAQIGPNAPIIVNTNAWGHVLTDLSFCDLGSCEAQIGSNAPVTANTNAWEPALTDLSF